MKNAIIILVIAMFATAWVLDSKAPPSPVPTGVKDVKQGKGNADVVEDNLIGDFKLTDENRNYTYRAGARDMNEPGVEKRNESDFQMLW